MQPNDTHAKSDFHEIRDLLAEVARRQARFQEETEEAARENREQNRALRESLAETDRLLKKSSEEADRRFRETDREIRELKQQLDVLGRQLGGLGQKFGGFTEGLAFPSMPKILKERFGATFVAPRARGWRNGHAMEVDVLAYSNSGTNEVYVVEVKSHLREDGLQQMLRTLREFRSFFPEHGSKKLYGILAVVDAPPDLQEKVLREGINLARIHDGVVEVQVPEGFHARAF
jgi:hypothetical protein